jgi:hypothetical protein
MDSATVLGRVAEVREAIARHQRIGGWNHPVTIVAVTKTHGPEVVRAAAAAGLRVLGENRVQEGLAKMAATADVPVEWHLVGSLQRNKVRQVIGRFGCIHSLDRPELVDELARRIPSGSRQRVLVEVNCAGESQKAGVAPADVEALVAAASAESGLVLEGLMTMAPLTIDPVVQRAVFRKLRELRDMLEAHGYSLPHLSMGMSGDYPVAVEEGATMVRLGTVLFGERAP